MRNQYPYPLAYVWRKAETHDPSTLQGVKHVLEAAESTVCFLAHIAIVGTRDFGISLGYLEDMGDELASNNRGTTFGDWITILEEATSKSFSSVGGSAPFPELFDALDQETTRQAIEGLKEKRNHLAHGRAPERESELGEWYTEGFSALEELYESIECLAESELRYVEFTELDTYTGVTEYTYRELTGDHPLSSRREDRVERTDLESRSLYLVDRTDELYLLRPFLTRKNCVECNRHAIFYLDYYKSDPDLCRLKSLEHGHIVEEENISEAFRRVGMLPEIS